MNEELAKYHDNIGVVMVKFCIVVKGICRHDKNNCQEKVWHNE